MPDDRPGEPGPDAASAASGARAGAAKGARARGGQGPKRTPRPDQPTSRRGGAANRSKGASANGGGAAKPTGAGAAGKKPANRARGTTATATPTTTRRPERSSAPADTDTLAADAAADTKVVAATREGLVEVPPDVSLPVVRPEESPVSLGRRRRGRRVHRVVRRIELWSVLKLSLVLYSCLYGAVLATLALLWGLAYSSGQIGKLQEFLAEVGLENYRFYGDQMFRACAAIGAVGVLAGTIITVLTAGLVNVISEMTGGIRLVVIEEEAPPRRP